MKLVILLLLKVHGLYLFGSSLGMDATFHRACFSASWIRDDLVAPDCRLCGPMMPNSIAGPSFIA